MVVLVVTTNIHFAHPNLGLLNVVVLMNDIIFNYCIDVTKSGASLHGLFYTLESPSFEQNSTTWTTKGVKSPCNVNICMLTEWKSRNTLLKNLGRCCYKHQMSSIR